MRFDSLLLELVLTPFYLFLFFVAVTLVLHFALVWRGELDEIQWKKADYAWLVCAVWGFVWLSTDINQTFSKTYVKYNDVAHTKFEYQELIDHLNRGTPVCLEYRKGEFSPPTFDDNMAENKALCDESKAYVQTMPKEVGEPFPTLDELGFTGLKSPHKYNDDYIVATQSYANRYTTSQKHYAQLTQAAIPSDGFQTIRLLSPLAFAIACAIRITKGSGEIKIAKRKKQIKNNLST